MRKYINFATYCKRQRQNLDRPRHFPFSAYQTGLILPTIRQTAGNLPVQYWLLALFIVMLFAMGGASRTDVQSLIILQPLSIVFCGIAMLTLRREHLSGRRWLFAILCIILLLGLLHVIPLPAETRQALPGQQELVDSGKLAGGQGNWRPLTLVPNTGWQALLSLFVPLAIILLGVQLGRNYLFRFLPLLIALTALSGLIGLLQVIGDPDGALYLYRITNNGSAVGLFANRNHAATLLACLFPMLAVFASTAKGTADEVRFRQLAAAAIAIILVPLILVTGSRSGLVSSLLGLCAAALLYRRPDEGRVVRRGTPKRVKMIPILGGLAAISLAFTTFFFSRAKAFERLFDDVSGEGARTDFWIVSTDIFWRYFPWGSGSGSYAEAFRTIEPSRMLDATYLNRAHNDWVEIAVTFGLPGMLVLAIAAIAFIARSVQLSRVKDGKQKSVAFGRMASSIILILAIASISDYPLRNPTMMGVFAIVLLWFTEAGRKHEAFAGHRADD